MFQGLLNLLFGHYSRTPAEGAYTLVVVDMQAKFRTSLNPFTLAAVKAEIRRAIALNNPIVILEYHGSGPTNQEITDLVRGYAHCETKIKTDDDGSVEVVSACWNNQFATDRFRVCGVNTQACVRETVSGLARQLRHSTIEVVKAACNDYPRNDWWLFPRRSNIKLTSVT